jgi:hypothetical protein
MSAATIQKMLLAGIPVYFYFVPEALFPFFYDKYIKTAYYAIEEANLLAFNRIRDLKNSISRVLRFVAFLSIVVVTLISTIYSKEHHDFFFRDCGLLSLLIALVGSASWVVYLNVKKELAINKYEQWLERAVLVLTIPLFYFWG